VRDFIEYLGCDRPDRIWDIPSLSNTPVANLEGHTGNITALAYSAQGKWIVTGSEDGTVKVWDTR
jgi:G protein beta subunit-like protein